MRLSEIPCWRGVIELETRIKQRPDDPKLAYQIDYARTTKFPALRQELEQWAALCAEAARETEDDTERRWCNLEYFHALISLDTVARQTGADFDSQAFRIKHPLPGGSP